jgi:transcriptional regulator with XRE-family HTH domain
VTVMAKRKPTSKPDSLGRAAKSEAPVVLGERVKALRNAMDWSQAELAWRANLSSVVIGLVERNEKGITAASLVRLALVLGTSLDYLVGFTENKAPAK